MRIVLYYSFSIVRLLGNNLIFTLLIIMIIMCRYLELWKLIFRTYIFTIFYQSTLIAIAFIAYVKLVNHSQEWIVFWSATLPMLLGWGIQICCMSITTWLDHWRIHGQGVLGARRLDLFLLYHDGGGVILVRVFVCWSTLSMWLLSCDRVKVARVIVLIVIVNDIFIVLAGVVRWLLTSRFVFVKHFFYQFIKIQIQNQSNITT